MKNNLVKLVKESIREQENYGIDQGQYRIKLNQNENPYPLPAQLRDQITEEWEKADWSRYPEVEAWNLRKIIAQTVNLRPEHIITASGSNEILRTLFSSLLGPGRKMVTLAPSFSLYAFYGNLLGAEVETLKLQGDFRFPLEQIIEEVKDPRVVLTVLCSPNNPTGNSMPEEEAEKILQSARGYVLIDEAYVDFCDQDFSGLSQKFSNLILLHTFSKAFSFAWGRCGFGIASPALVEQLYKVLPPYNLNGFIQTAAGIILQNRKLVLPVIEKIIQERNRMQKLLSQNSGLEVYPSQTNFILIRPFLKVSTLMKALQEKSILIRDVSSYPGLSNEVRITVGRPEENDEVVRALEEITGG